MGIFYKLVNRFLINNYFFIPKISHKGHKETKITKGIRGYCPKVMLEFLDKITVKNP